MKFYYGGVLAVMESTMVRAKHLFNNFIEILFFLPEEVSPSHTLNANSSVIGITLMTKNLLALINWS